MNYDAILFDMDGTLLPMDQKVFVKQYFIELAKVLCPLGIEAGTLKEAFWGGVNAMVANDGTTTNEDVFWKHFRSVVHVELAFDKLKEITTRFYSNEFHNVKGYIGKNPLARKAVELAHKCAPKVILATNPLFPIEGQVARLSWVDLGKNDFDLITSYETNSYCKPNPKYFEAICEKMEINPNNCLMIGNDELEDMHTASSIGMDCYMVTDSEILRDGFSWDGKKGTFEELIKWLEK